MSSEIQQCKESISDRYIKDFKKELKFFEKAMILPIEKKMKEILKSDKKIDVSNLRDLEDLGFWRKVLGAKIGQKQLFEGLMTKTFNFLKEKQEKIIEAESAGRLEELTSLVINGKLDELDNLVESGNPIPQDNNLNSDGGDGSETPENSGGNPNSNDSQNPNSSESGNVAGDEGEDSRSMRERIQDNAALTSAGVGIGGAAAFGTSMNNLANLAGKGSREALEGVGELSLESTQNLMRQSADVLESQVKTNTHLSKVMKRQYEKSISEFRSASTGITGETVQAVKIWETFGDRLPQSLLKNIRIKPETAKLLGQLDDLQIDELRKATDLADFNKIFSQAVGREVTVGDDVFQILKVAKDVKEFKSITTIFKELKSLRQFLKCIKGACLLSFAFLGFDIWAFIETGKEADMIKQYNQERGMYKQQWANAQLWIGVGGVVLDILIAVGAYVGIGACCGPWGAVAGLLVGVTQMLVTFALEGYYAREEFYAQNRIDFSTKSRTYVKQSIVQLLESDRKDLNEGMKAEVRELRGPDSEADTLEDAWEALIFQEECEVGGYMMIQQYYYSGKSEEDFLKDLPDDEKNRYNEQKQELEGVIKVRMDYIKKYIKEDQGSPEYLSMKRKLESRQGISYVEQVLADSKIYATLQGEIDEPYIENYKNLDVAGYKEAYKDKLKSEYPKEFELFENLSNEKPAALTEILTGCDVLGHSISEYMEGSDDLFSDVERNNIKKNLEFVEKYSEYFYLGKPIEKISLVNGMSNNIDFGHVEQLLADNFESINKRQSWDKETTLYYMSGSEYRNRLEAKYEVSDSLTENILYSIAKEFHGYQGVNETMDLIKFYNEGDKNSLGIYYDKCRRFNLDWWHDVEITSDISKLDRMPTERILQIFKRGELDSDAEAADDAVNYEYQKRIQEIIVRETNYRANKGEYEQQIFDFVKSSSVDGGYVELPYDLIIAAKKAGIGKVENYLFSVQGGEIHAISCGDTVDDVLHFDNTNQKINYEANMPLRDNLTEEENNLIKSVDNICEKLTNMRKVEMDFYHDHTDELDIPVQLERIMSKKQQDWEKEKDMLYYMDPNLAKDYLKEKAKDYYDYFDGLYRGLLATITSYKNSNDINDVNGFNMALRWTSQFDILSINDKGEFKFDSSVPETIAKALPELFDYYKDQSTGKTVTELLHSSDDEEKTKGQFLARQIYTVFLEESVLYYRNGTLNDFHVDGEYDFDINKIKIALNTKMNETTFEEVYKNIDNMNTDNIVLNEKGIRQVLNVEKQFHKDVESATEKIIKDPYALTGTGGIIKTDEIDWAGIRGDPTFEADTEQKEDGKVTGVLKSWGSSERITVITENGGESIKSVFIDGLDMSFSDTEEGFRVANLINWIRKNKKDEPKGKRASNRLVGCYDDYIRNDGKLDRDVTYNTNNVVILYADNVNRKYKSIKNSQKFLDYINSYKV